MLRGGDAGAQGGGAGAGTGNAGPPRVKLVLLGDTSVGKSCLALRFVRGTFDEQSKVTVGGQTVKFEIWDTAGQERYASLAPLYYRGASAAAVVYDVSEPSSFAKARYWTRELQKHGQEGIVMCLVANKMDLPESARCVPVGGGGRRRGGGHALLRDAVLQQRVCRHRRNRHAVRRAHGNRTPLLPLMTSVPHICLELQVVATLDRAAFARLPDLVHQALRGQVRTYKDLQLNTVAELSLLEEVDRELGLAFRMIDTDGSGTIDASEIKVMARALGMELTLPHIDAIMLRMDEDGSGEVDYEEFLQTMTEELFTVTTAQRMDEGFRALCRLGGDQLGPSEGINRLALKRVSEAVGDHLTDGQITSLMEAAWVERYGSSGEGGGDLLHEGKEAEAEAEDVESRMIDFTNFTGIVRCVS